MTNLNESFRQFNKFIKMDNQKKQNAKNKATLKETNEGVKKIAKQKSDF